MEDDENLDLITELGHLCSKLKHKLPNFHTPQPNQTFIGNQGQSITVKIPSKLISVIGSLAWRAHDLGEMSHELYLRDRVIPAVILTRALMETTALLYLVYKKVKTVIASKNIAELDSFLVTCMAGSRTETSAPKAINILTAIEHLDKEEGAERYLSFYHTLSEFAHPNSLGTFYAYADFDKQTRKIGFGHNKGLTKGNDCAFAAVFALEVLLHFFDITYQLIPDITQLAIALYESSE